MAGGGGRAARVKPNNQSPQGPIGNTTGLITPQTEPNLGGPSAPPIKPTKKEESWWGTWGGVVHGALDVVGLIPVVGEVADGANALIYLAEGDKVNAALSAASMLPVGGQAATAAKWGKKGIDAAQGVKAATKVEREAVEKAAKKEAKEEAAEAGAKGGRNKGGGKDKGKGGPCDHLKQGNGTGPYRGGAHSKTSKPVNDGKESHHMPADDVSPIPRKEGPAIQMEPEDHKQTSSRGSGKDAVRYRSMIEGLLKDGQWRTAMLEEIKDIRDIASRIGEPRKYNEAMLEMLEYFKCLEKNGLLPNA